MAQKNVQVQTTTQAQQQTQLLSPLQVMVARLTEMPLDAVLQKVDSECMENPWLERSVNADAPREQTSEEDARFDFNSEDDIPDYLLRQPSSPSEKVEYKEWGDSQSFYDKLREQMGEFELTPHQQDIMEYLIGSLDDDGLLHRPLYQISDELAIYRGVNASEQEIEEVLSILWQFEPAGVGARNVQESLLLQVRRDTKNPWRKKMEELLTRHFNDFMKKHWDEIQQHMHLTPNETKALRTNILRLNPRPGTALGENIDEGSQHITPDFIVDTDSCDTLTLTLNEGDMPTLTISEDALSQQTIPYVREYVEQGQMFISALTQRRDTLLRTMRAILHKQRKFFLEGDESLLHPMILEDIATEAGLDISTISRACSNKYVQTPYGTYSLRWFFNKGTTLGEDTVSVNQLKVALREVVDGEDKKHPLNDDQLAAALKEKGFGTARRTVSKYREQMGIPVARLRKK